MENKTEYDIDKTFSISHVENPKLISKYWMDYGIFPFKNTYFLKFLIDKNDLENIKFILEYKFKNKKYRLPKREMNKLILYAVRTRKDSIANYFTKYRHLL